MNPKLLLLAVVAVVVAIGAILPGAALQSPPVEPEELDVDMFYQYSATDDDAEVTIDVEADIAIDHLIVRGPDSQKIVSVASHNQLGLREVEVESDEPSVEEVQLAYPEGDYSFKGRAVDGTFLVGEAEITHDVVAAPDFVDFSPCNEVVDHSVPIAITWNPVSGADGGYELIIEQDDTGANLRITISAGSTSFVIPDGLLAPGLDYEIEMKAVSAQGNKTSASCEFSTM